MNYNLNFNCRSGIMAVPCDAVDKYINTASHDDLKILLYIFRHSDKPVDPSEICEKLCLSVNQFKRSIKFWADAGIFVLSSENTSQKEISLKEPEIRDKIESARESAAAHKIINTHTQYGQEEITKKSQENEEIRFLLESVPEQLGKLISPSECSILIYLYEEAGLPADVILMLVGYCVSFGKNNMRYIEKMAISWAEEGIDTHEKAESKIRELEERRSFEGQVRHIMGISDRALAPTERQHILKWCSWKMPLELIKLAYDICVSRTGKLSFAYINKILISWHEKGYTTVEQAKNENKRNKALTGKSPSYDIDEYVRLSMKSLHNE